MLVRFVCNKLQRISWGACPFQYISRGNLNHIPFIIIKCLHLEANDFINIHKKYKHTTITQFNIREQDISVVKSDPDKFGLISNSDEFFDNNPNSGDLEEENFLQYPPTASQKLDLKGYALLIKYHLEHNRIKEAIDVLEIRMLKEDRVKPGKYIFNLLISGCAKAGYSKKAFQLYNKMKQRNLKVTPSIYTSLFNACANTPWPEDGLNKANRLREIILEKGYNPNSLNYNAMIKAYGRCGDVKTAFQIADEMMEKNVSVNTETFNFLLQACASDKDFGFRHALLTWHKMLKRNVSPDIYTFNTMLRCVRDCSIGDLETMEQVLMQILSKSVEQIEECEKMKMMPTTEKTFDEDDNGEKDRVNESNISGSILTENMSNTTSEVVTHETSFDETPNLLCRIPHLGCLLAISEVKNPEDRLLLLGGFSGFLEEMEKFEITPGIDTFTTLLEVIPPTTSAEKKLISMIRKIGLKVDIDFFNVLIKKRSMRFDYSGAKEVLNMIKTAKLHPDIITYGVLALGCRTQEDARELINHMREKEIKMNIQICGAMLRQGCCQKLFQYVSEILQITLDENIRPNEEFLRHLDTFNKSCLKLIYQKHPSTKSNSFRNDFNKFKNKLNIWYEEWNIKDLKLEDAIKKIKEKPYTQFKEEQTEGFEGNKNEKFLKKQKIRKYIKKIKLKDESKE